jgi:hypothetical protein
VIAYGSLAAVGLATSDFATAIHTLRHGLTIVGPRVSTALAVAVAASWLATAVCGWLLVRRRLRVPSLLVVCAVVAAPVAATLASLAVMPASHARAAAAASFEEGVEVRADAVAAVAAVDAVGLWSASLGLVLATAAFALSTGAVRKRWRHARRRAPRRPHGALRLVLGAGGLAIAAAASALFESDRPRLVLVPAAIALLAVHLGRDGRRTADVAAGLCGATAVVTATIATALTTASAVGSVSEGSLAAIAQSAALHHDQQLVSALGALFLLPAAATAWLPASHKTLAARRQASRIVGSGLLLAAVSAAAAAVVMPDRWDELSTAWSRHLPAGFEAPRLALEGCAELEPDEIVYVGDDVRFRGESLGAADRLDGSDGCAAIAQALPAAPTVAVAATVPAKRITGLIEALAAHTCTVRWLAHREGIDVAAPVCLTTPLAGRACPTPAGPFALIDEEGAILLTEDAGRRLPRDALTGGMIAASDGLPWVDLLRVAQRRDEGRLETPPTTPFHLAIAEPAASTPPNAELVLPFRSVVELRLTPSNPALEAALAPLSDRLRRCHQSAADWPPASIVGVHWLLPGAPTKVWRTEHEPRAGASACVARALSALPVTGEPVRLEVTIRTLLPRVELRLASEAEPATEAAFEELRDAIQNDRADLDRCFRAGLMADPSLAAPFTLSLARDDRDYVDVHGTETAPRELAGCVANVLRQQRWPALAFDAIEVVVELILPE